MNTIATVLLLLAAPATAQDTLRLPAVQQAAVQQDPRARQLALQEAATELRLRDIAAERLPSIAVGLCPGDARAACQPPRDPACPAEGPS